MPARSPLPPLLAAALLAAVVLVALAIPAPRAHAASRQLSVMQDDNLLLYSSTPARRHTLDQMKALGADAVRVTVLWSLAASHVRERVRRTHAFRAGDPAVYPHKNWDRYDRLVLDAARPRPLRATSTSPARARAGSARRAPDGSGRRTWRPKVREYARFLKALGNRYSGTYRTRTTATRPPARLAAGRCGTSPTRAAG